MYTSATSDRVTFLLSNYVTKYVSIPLFKQHISRIFTKYITAYCLASFDYNNPHMPLKIKSNAHYVFQIFLISIFIVTFYATELFSWANQVNIAANGRISSFLSLSSINLLIYPISPASTVADFGALQLKNEEKRKRFNCYLK